MSRKNWIVIVLVLALVLLLVLIFSGPGQPISYKKLFSNDEAKDLLDLNQAAIAQSNSASSSSIPPLNKQDHILGQANAKVKMIVYENPNDLYSIALASNLSTVLSENQDVALAIRYYFPKNDTAAWQNAVALECASQNGKYFEARSWLFDKISKKEPVSWDEGQRSLGVNFGTCLNDKKIKTAIEVGLDNAKDTPVFGAPTLFVGSEIITGSRPLDDSDNSAGEKLEGLRNIVKRQLGA